MADGFSPEAPQLVTVEPPPPLRLMYQRPVEGRNTAMSVLPSPLKSAGDLLGVAVAT